MNAIWIGALSVLIAVIFSTFPLDMLFFSFGLGLIFFVSAFINEYLESKVDSNSNSESKSNPSPNSNSNSGTEAASFSALAFLGLIMIAMALVAMLEELRIFLIEFSQKM